jgi:hypothetical protein
MTGTDSDNVVGALLFYAYMIAALGLTGLICKDLCRDYSCRSLSRAQPKGKNDAQTPAPRSWRVPALMILSGISFVTLSYHMLNFLVQSYHARYPAYNLSDVSLPSIWKWSVESTLFRDFTEVICNDPRRFLWTNAALAYSLGWNTYMAVEGEIPPLLAEKIQLMSTGVRYEVPHLLAYFLLDQILPVSFTQNLFLLAVELKNQRRDFSVKIVEPRSEWRKWLLISMFFGALSIAPRVAATSSILVVLLATRFILFAPYWISRPEVKAGDMGDGNALASAVSFLSLPIFGPVLAWAVYLMFWCGYVLRDIWLALDDSPAVSALGYDFFLGAVSLVVVSMLP